MKTNSILSVILISILLSGCSLLKLQPQFAGEALPKQDLNKRMAVRSFYKNFSGEVMQAADSIFSMSNDLAVKSEAIKWKGAATSACVRTAFQTDAEVALVETWLLTRQMDEYLNSRGEGFFGEFQQIATACSGKLYEDIQKIARRNNHQKDFELLSEFVLNYPVKNDFQDWQFTKMDVRQQLLEHLQIPDSAYTTTVGTGAEVMNDFTDRISVYNDQIKSQLSWEKDLVLLTFQDDSIAQPYLARIDSLSQMLNRLAIVAQESPEMMGVIAVRMREELSPIVSDLNSGMRSSIEELSNERAQLQEYLNTQRVLLRDDMTQSGKELIQETTDNLIRFVRQISWLIIIVVIVLVAIIFGLPFMLGYLLAKARFKNKNDNQ
ncbi:MAG: hypothetical protein N4A71_28085 [Carboxylicivirga sp.]|jgi:PBP1b-binding outer membrane lipoprotein LpoB|nr:hypothetical protein [Carboxylicivirga sp.]